MHPREFGKFRILKLLPLGGMGRVYLALDTSTNTQVALKLIELGSEPEIAEIVEAERRGAILQARLCGVDPRVTLIRSYGEFEGFFYIEMEYVEGQDLSEVLQRGALGVPFAARIGLDLCEVLHQAHTFKAEIEGHQYQGIVHGDIKPRNIRITPDGQVKVLDFGIAKALSLTRKFTTNRFGSSQYSSPERLNSGEVDAASDLWSVAVVLYEIVTAKPYFDAPTAAKIEHLIRNYRTLGPMPENLPPRFLSILKRALDPDPARRYPDARLFAADLRAFLENRETVAETMPDVDAEATRRTPPVADISIGDIGFDDEEATRRITTPDEAATRRTAVPSEAEVAAGLSSGAFVKVPKATRRSVSRRQRQVRFFTGMGAVIVLGIVSFNELSALRQASSLQHDVESERLTDMSAAWARYEKVRVTGLLPLWHRGPRKAIQNRLIASADRVLNEYRDSDSPNVSEADWVRAQAALAKALELDDDDKNIRGKLYIAEGHIYRIRGTSRKLPKLLSDSRARFEEARDLLPRSPDPYLGLARLYVYSLQDVERAEDALREARKRDYDWGRREKTQLADGYRERADRFMREAARVTGLPEEEDYLKRAEKDYRKAEDLYREVVPFSSSAASLRRVFEQLELVNYRLDAIKEGA